MRHIRLFINKYAKIEALGGIALLLATILGLTIANSRYSLDYQNFINFPLHIGAGNIQISKSISFWINDGLVAIFFFLIGLEIKREFYAGELSERGQITLPCSAAIAGMIIPALIYALFNYANPVNMRGWAIPGATDTAFALGLLALFGSKIPKSLKIFLTTLAVIDDILAVFVIAIFYADELSHLSVLASASILGILVLLNQASVKNAFLYTLLGILLWLFVLKSGVHTSIAGVLFALTIPIKNGSHKNTSLLVSMEKTIHPWVSFLILPLFAFINSGVPLNAFTLDLLINPLSLGIIFGLFLGKQLGIFGITYLLVKTKIVTLPHGATWLQTYGLSVLCGVGFTMSLFIGILSFESGGPEYGYVVKISILIGSLISALFGCLILFISRIKK